MPITARSAPSAFASASAVVADGAAPIATDAGGDGGRDEQAMAEQAMQKIEEVATIIAANKNDCTQLGLKMTEYYDANAAFVVDAKEAYGAMAVPARKALQQKLRKRFDSAWKKLQPTIRKCKDEPNVAHVLDKVF